MLNCQICEHNPTGERCELFGRVIGMHGCSSGVERKPRNHYEAVKAMSMEEMAKLLDNARASCGGVMGGRNCMADCRECWLDWLKEEITDA